MRARAEFLAVQNSGRRVPGRFVTLIGAGTDLERDRLGIVASKRVGGAVARNRAKRRLRELFRRTDPAEARERTGRAMDVVAIARREIVEAPFADVEADFAAALQKLRRSR